MLYLSHIQIHIDVWHIFTTNIVEHFSPFTRLWFYFAGTQGKGFIVLFMKNIVTTTKNIYVTSETGVQMNISTSQNLDPTLKAQIDRMVDIPSNELVVILSAKDWTVFKKKEKLSSLKFTWWTYNTHSITPTLKMPHLSPLPLNYGKIGLSIYQEILFITTTCLMSRSIVWNKSNFTWYGLNWNCYWIFVADRSLFW